MRTYQGIRFNSIPGQHGWRLWHEWLQCSATADDMAKQLQIPCVDTDLVMSRVVALRAKAEVAARILLEDLRVEGREISDISPADLGEAMIAISGGVEDERGDAPLTPEEQAEELLRGKPQ